MEPTVERRLRDADPLAGRADIDDDRDQHWLLESARAVMGRDQPPRLHRALIVGAVAAATVVAAALSGSLFLSGGADGPVASRDAALTVTDLALVPDTPTMSSCIAFSLEALADMPIAFSGEVAERASSDVLITVDTWYRGPDTDQVRLVAPDMSMTSLGATIDFQEGSSYLVTATNGVVNYCGFSGVWSQDLADAFATAFKTP